MAAWYGNLQGKEVFKELNLTDYANDSHLMLREFWLSLLTQAKGCKLYFTTGLAMMPYYPLKL